LYDLAKASTRALPRTDGASDMYWSADNHSLLVTRNNTVYRIDIHGDAPQPLSIESGYSSWGPEGVVTATRAGLSEVHPESSGSRLSTSRRTTTSFARVFRIRCSMSPSRIKTCGIALL
jgi:hypothetical protein